MVLIIWKPGARKVEIMAATFSQVARFLVDVMVDVNQALFLQQCTTERNVTPHFTSSQNDSSSGLALEACLRFL